MKIKTLEWEACTPTVSSSVVSRAKALGYTFEVTESFDVYINGHYMCAGSPETKKSEEFCQEWLEDRISEVVEDIPLVAAQIQWDRPFGDESWGKYVSKDGLYTVHATYDLGRFYPEYNHLGTQAILPDLSLTSFGGKCARSLEEAFARCQDHKQAELEKALKMFLVQQEAIAP